MNPQYNMGVRNPIMLTLSQIELRKESIRLTGDILARVLLSEHLVI